MKRQNIFIIFFNLYTVIIWFLMILEFISKGDYHLPTVLTTLYIILLTFFATDKEVRRRSRKLLRRNKHGEIFVYVWVLTLVFVVAFYLFGGDKAGYVIPKDLPTIAGSVMIIYIITEYLKEEFRKRR